MDIEADAFRSKKEITRTFYGSEIQEVYKAAPAKKKEGISDLSMRHDLQQRRPQMEHSPVSTKPQQVVQQESPAQISIKRRREMLAGINDESTFVITQLPQRG